MLERRERERWPAYWAGEIGFRHGQSVAECLIRNTSGQGAKLVLGGDAVFVPREFVLNIPKHRTEYQAKVVWRRAAELGVVFKQVGRVDAPTAAPRKTRALKPMTSSLPLHEALTPMALLRQLKKLRQQHAALRRRLLLQTD